MKTGILKVVAYFDLFNYPVSGDEILFLMEGAVDKRILFESLDQLVQAQCLFRFGEFYSLSDDPEFVIKRLEGNERAKPLLEIAKRVGGFISRFPFVRGVALSGSLSKNFADKNADIDLFIITKANRLWIARTLLHLFKKFTYLTGRQHWYCMNYFIDEEAIQIQEKNIFTATELITLKPLYGNDCMKQFFRANDWANLFFPNYRLKGSDLPSGRRDPGGIKKVIESLFNNRVGERLDEYLKNLTTQRWALKEERHKLNVKGNRMGLRTGKHFSKPNPVFFQEKLLSRYSKNKDEWEKKWAEKGIQDPEPFFLKEII